MHILLYTNWPVKHHNFVSRLCPMNSIRDDWIESQIFQRLILFDLAVKFCLMWRNRAHIRLKIMIFEIQYDIRINHSLFE